MWQGVEFMLWFHLPIAAWHNAVYILFYTITFLDTLIMRSQFSYENPWNWIPNFLTSQGYICYLLQTRCADVLLGCGLSLWSSHISHIVKEPLILTLRAKTEMLQDVRKTQELNKLSLVCYICFCFNSSTESYCFTWKSLQTYLIAFKIV
jgi:hypothetical protein